MDSASPATAGIGRESNGAAGVAFTAPRTGNFKRDWARTPRTTRFGGSAVAAFDSPRRRYRRAGHPPATGDGHL